MTWNDRTGDPESGPPSWPRARLLGYRLLTAGPLQAPGPAHLLGDGTAPSHMLAAVTAP